MKQKLINYLRNLICSVGATSSEYAIIIVLIAAVIVIVLASLGGVAKDLFDIPSF